MESETNVMQTVVGTPLFHAPEMLSLQYVSGGQQSHADGVEYGEGVDVWCLGLILYNMLSGVFPFSNRRPLIDQFSTVLNGLETKAWEGVSDDAKDLVCQCLICDPKERISAEGMLRGKWLSSESSSISAPPSRSSSCSPSPQRRLKRLKTDPSS